MKTETISHSGGERKYRIKKDTLSGLENGFTDLTTGKTKTYTQFEKHMIQEGVKQVLFAQGSEEMEVRLVNAGKGVVSSSYLRVVPKETIQFLLDYDVIEEFKY